MRRLASSLGLVVALTGCADRTTTTGDETDASTTIVKASSQGATDATTAGSTSDATTEATSSASTSSASTDDPIEDPCGPPGPTPADLDALCGLADVFFAAGSDVLDGYARCRLSVAAPCFADGELILEAHASDAEGTHEETILLTDRRGHAVLSFLAAHGVPPDRMQIISYGDLDATIPSVETDQRVIFVFFQHPKY